MSTSIHKADCARIRCKSISQQKVTGATRCTTVALTATCTLAEARTSRSEAWCLDRPGFRFSPNGRYLAYRLASDTLAMDEEGLPIVLRILDMTTGENVFDRAITRGHPWRQVAMYGSWARAALEQPAVWNADSTAVMVAVPRRAGRDTTELLTVDAGLNSCWPPGLASGTNCHSAPCQAWHIETAAM